MRRFNLKKILLALDEEPSEELELMATEVIRGLLQASGANPITPPRFSSEDEAMSHATLLARLQPGTLVCTVSDEGEQEKGVIVFVQNNLAHLLQWDRKTGQLMGSVVPLTCVHLPETEEPRQ